MIMDKAIFRVSNCFGSRDYDSLKEAKRDSHDGEFISFSYDWQNLSTVKRRYATPSWAKKCADKYMIGCIIEIGHSYNPYL